MREEQHNPENYTEEYFQTLIEQVDNHSAWNYSDQYQSMDEAIEDAATYPDLGLNEITFTHNEADGYLGVQFPTEEFTSPLQGTVTNTIVPEPHYDLPNVEFFTELEQSYQDIANKHTTGYVDSVGSTKTHNFSLMSIDVPFEYDQTVLEESLDSLDNATREAEELNEQLMELLR